MKAWRGWRWTAGALLLLLLWTGLGRAPLTAEPSAARPSAAVPDVSAATPAAAFSTPPESGTLLVGTYLTSLDTIDLANSSFQAGFYLWTLWRGPEESDPSGSLELLNDIYNGDVYQFDRLARRRQGDLTWSLYTVHSRFLHRWRLRSYPFDRHDLRIRVGLRDPLATDVRLAADQEHSGASPELFLYGWTLRDVGISEAPLSLLSNLGRSPLEPRPSAEAQTVTTSIELVRQSRLHLLPDFLGYVLAVGLCVLALLIQRTRDDLILAAVVSAAGNYVFLAGILPVGAMSGFIGKLQLVILAGILYVVGADEILDHHLGEVAPRWANLLRSVVLPSYLLLTMVAVYWIIPSGIVEGR